MDSRDLGEIRKTLAESQDIGLIVKLIQLLLDERCEAVDTVESEGHRYRIAGELLPAPHLAITPIDN